MVCRLSSKYIVSPSSLTCVTHGAPSSHCRGSHAMVHLCPSALRPHPQSVLATVIIVSVVVVVRGRGLRPRNNFRVNVSCQMASAV